MSRVLVTGGSGFVGSHQIALLLDRGHEVRATVRDPSREDLVRSLVGGDGRSTQALRIVGADLSHDEGWAEAMRGCDYALHIASPFPASSPKDEAELVGPARDGTVRVLKAARDAGVRRVVLTSSFAAIGYGHPAREAAFTEDDWTDPEAPDVQPYMRSKVLAERAAWDFVARDGGDLELAVVNPVGIFGPVLGRDYSSSIEIVRRMLTGAMPACPKVYFCVVDVRDVVDLQLRAMTATNAKGQRFVAAAGEPWSLLDVATLLRERLGEAGKRAPTRELPNWLVRALALVRPELREVVPQLGVRRRVRHDKAERELGWTPRSEAEALVATAQSLDRFGLLAG